MKEFCNRKKRIAILGSTGSIGTQTLDIISEHSKLFEATVLVAGRNARLLIEQALKHRPKCVVIADESQFGTVSEVLSPLGIEVGAGRRAVVEAVGRDDVDTVVTATVGYSGLEPTIAAIRHNKDIALANKETLVVAGEYVRTLLAQSKSGLMPVDSEHSAIAQCLVGESNESVARLIITASGGPFRNFNASDLEKVTVADALHHPNWSMGAKITIDSATMMNKAFEIIEARWLFDIPANRIEAVVHPQSIVHSMVEFVDGSVKAQLGLPDMHLPIRYALGVGERLTSGRPRLTLADYSRLTFEEPDERLFPCLKLARKALRRGGNAACIINAANEIAVASFLEGRIRFVDIYPLIMATLSRVDFIPSPTYEEYVATNDESRRVAQSLVDEKKF
ncbi:MAG: 1-deoxy-D-xylulose-5-phosphate reductoisomerase [Bacteroides sp.]|nr:1-deoxy-D-xylulose-5-phosphate reductoisomerase [Bacteroides sp.]MCM1414177.1 1-deoxy-D-xylulose-5-phosphate reductoisomerase [Bacteroides sp.]MCM1471273.1 1-deoxy-D-xylulose-5-phosphate reductoisomerase [Bacteroides sp.]